MVMLEQFWGLLVSVIEGVSSSGCSELARNITLSNTMV